MKYYKNNSFLRNSIRKIIPLQIRSFIWGLRPKVFLLNTYILNNPKSFVNKHPIDNKYRIREVTSADICHLKTAYNKRGPRSYNRIPDRLSAPEWHGLAVFDSNTGGIAYIAWIIDNSIPFFEEFGITLRKDQFLLKDGFCVPEYRHQGLHTRMEQERINYCVNNGAKDIFIQIHDSNKKGIQSVTENGYIFFKQNLILLQ